jgi:signal transduction histidine kinase
MTNEILLYLLIGLCFLIVVFVIYLASTGKLAKKQPVKEVSSPAQSQRSGTRAKRTSENNSVYVRTGEHFDASHYLETIKKLQDENSILKMQVDAQTNQIEILKRHNSELSDVNNELSQQKERLSSSKQQLESLQQRKEDLFAMAIHDIKNPAGAIKGYVDLLRSYDLNAVEQQEIMGHLVQTSSRIVEIAQSISTIIAEAETNNSLKLKRSPIKAIIDDVCNRNLVYANGKSVKIINSSSPDSPPVLVDKFKIEEAIENLVNNAIKFAKPETIVQVRSYFSSTDVIIEVADNGVGMSKEDAARAFSKGAKLTAQPTGGETSSGLGLWIVKNIIEGHGGKIELESKLGSGTKFTIKLPIELKE